MKKNVLILSLFLGCTQPSNRCLDVVVVNDNLQTIKTEQKASTINLKHIASTCDCYTDWDSLIILNPLLVDSTMLMSKIKIDKNLLIQKTIYAVNKFSNSFIRSNRSKL